PCGDSRPSADPLAWVHDKARHTSRASAVLGAIGGVRPQENLMRFHLDWLQTGRAPRGTPRPGGRPRRPVALGLIAGLALLPVGCQSGPYCGSCGFIRRATDRVLHRSSGCCDSGVATAPPIEYGAPASVVAPSVGSPQFPAGTVPSDVTVP